MSARKELRRLLAEAKTHLDAYEEYVRKLEEEAGAQAAVAGAPPPTVPAAEERTDTREGLRSDH